MAGGSSQLAAVELEIRKEWSSCKVELTNRFRPLARSIVLIFLDSPDDNYVVLAVTSPVLKVNMEVETQICTFSKIQSIKKSSKL